MERADFVEHAGVRILHVDLSGLRGIEELQQVARYGSALARAEPSGAVLVLIDLTGVPYSLRVVRELAEIAAANAAFVRARAVVGLDAIALPAIRAIAQFTRRPVQAFADADAARDWLVAQAAPAPGRAD